MIEDKKFDEWKEEFLVGVATGTVKISVEMGMHVTMMRYLPIINQLVEALEGAIGCIVNEGHDSTLEENTLKSVKEKLGNE